MPRATVTTDAERHPLKMAPPDGFVVLRRMSYGEVLHRRDMGMKMSMEGAGKKDSRIDIATIQTATTFYEFQKTIVDHNLEDETGRKLDFSNMADFQRLDPRVAAEIEELIKDMNMLEGEEKDSLFQRDQAVSGNEPSSYGEGSHFN